MSKFLIRRILLGILIVVLGALVTYTVIRCLPASYMEKMARQLSAGSQGRVRWLPGVPRSGDGQMSSY